MSFSIECRDSNSLQFIMTPLDLPLSESKISLLRRWRSRGACVVRSRCASSRHGKNRRPTSHKLQVTNHALGVLLAQVHDESRSAARPSAHLSGQITDGIPPAVGMGSLLGEDTVH